MRTIYALKGHTELANESAGKKYGHVPGHRYHDVDVVISHRGVIYRVVVCESWGSAQGCDEEHGRREVVGRGESIHKAVEVAMRRATEANITTGYLVEAMSRAEDKAEELVLAIA